MDTLLELWSRVPVATKPLIEIFVAIVIAIVLHSLLWRVVSKMIGGRTELIYRVIRRLKTPLRLMFIVAAIGFASRVADMGTDLRNLVSQFSLALAVMIAGWISMIAVDVYADRETRRLRLDAEDNLVARKLAAQIKMLRMVTKVVLFLLTAGLALSVFDAVRSFGVSLFASAGVAGIVAGYAATPVLKNLIAGIQIALTQPIRIDDVVIVEGEWGWIEEIASTYVVVRIWDLRRMVLPLSYFIENPFQNWTRESANIIGSVMFYVDYTAPVAQIREKFEEAVRASSRWDGNAVVLQVIDTDKDTVQLRGLCSSRNSPLNWELRCEVREKVLSWLQESYPEALPKHRIDIDKMPEVDKTPIPT